MLSSPLEIIYGSYNILLKIWMYSSRGGYVSVQGPGLFEPIHGSAPDIAGQVKMTSIFLNNSFDTGLA